MAHILKARVAETSISTGTGDFTLSGAVTAHKTFASRMSVADTTEYVIYAVDANGIPTGEWEEGVGTYSAANTLTRTTVAESSNADAAVDFAAGAKVVIMTPLASRVAAILKGGTSGQTLVKTGAGDFEWAWVDTPAGPTGPTGPTGPAGADGADGTAADVAASIHAAAAKTTLVDADEVGGTDSAASYSLIRTTWANVWTYIKSKADAIYQATLVSGTSIKTVNGSSLLGSGDVTVAASIAPLVVEDANTIAQRNGTTAQASYLYNTRTDASNYERGFMRWASNVLEIGTEKAGTGTARGISIGAGLAALNKNIRFFSGGRGQLDIVSGSFDGGDPYIVPSGTSQHLLLGGSTVRSLATFGVGNSNGPILTISAPAITSAVAIYSSCFNGLTSTISMGGRGSDGLDDAQGDFIVKSNDRGASSFNNFPAAGALVLRGGAGASGATTQAAHGGNVNVAGGQGYGTGTSGTINLAYTGSAARGAVKCWGTLTMDAPLLAKQYTTATRPTFAAGAVIYDSDLDKLVIGGASAWEVVTSA